MSASRRRERPFVLRLLAAGATGVTLLSGASPARAQADVSPPLPNTLLLVDTSGSMEFKTDGSEVTCNPNLPAAVNDRSRWIDLVEVLTGTLENYSCEKIDRRTDQFKNGFYGSYAVGGTAPYDYRYPIPYHRPLSNGCAVTPGALPPANPFLYPTGGTSRHMYNNGPACTTFSQPANDGILDVHRTFSRFALMTFDTSTDAGTGFAGTTTTATANYATGRAGLWSYIPTTTATGMPDNCLTGTEPQEVGARNGAAPVWEGRLVNFGDPDDGTKDYETHNARIQEVLLATRPFGATPIAGMLKDALDFLTADASKDPEAIAAGVSAASRHSDFGPWQDPYLSCGRKQSVLLLTDGMPNLDLRPYCESAAGDLTPGKCPFDKPEDTARELANRGIPTNVVAFALEQVDDGSGPASCNASMDCSAARTATNPALLACCTLQAIATAGNGKAYFASNRQSLRSAISDILKTNAPTTSRTQVAVSGGGVASAGSFRFFSGFSPGNQTPWVGHLDRQRWVCDDATNPGVPTPQPITASAGDDFAHNVNKAGPDARRIYTFLGGNSASDPLSSLESMRPQLKGADPLDGVGSYGARVHTGTTSAFISGLPSAALSIPTSACVDDDSAALANASACRDFYAKWWLGLSNGGSGRFTRCASPGSDCALVGDIYHSTPAVVGRPSAFLRDESYARFAYLAAKRPVVLYTSTNDGFLHAFKVVSNDPADASDDAKMVRNDGQSNELWAFAPPAVLPNLYHLYPYNHQLLLDGTPIVTDVVAKQPLTGQPIDVFERSAADARAGAAEWRTVLVQSFGAEHGGYFALDVTNPVPVSGNESDVTKGGPRFLWQLTRDAAGTNLFGRGGATPAITTLYFDPSGGTNPREIPVAVLPGGPGGVAVAAGPGSPARSFTDSNIDGKYPPRSRVRQYTYDGDQGARSLTIVRLDTGEIVRTFRQSKTEVVAALQSRTTEVASLDSPVTGQPVAFPGAVGAVADRIFVGDRDGRFWRVDVASDDPADWTMKLFFDTFPASFNSVTGHDFDDGQPIMLPPVISVDENENVTINLATGDQESLGAAPTQVNYVYSLTEKLNVTRTTLSPTVNWYKRLEGGERPIGPMALFNGYLYFASFTPASAGTACVSGVSKVWGMHYFERMDQDPTAPDPALGGLGAPDFPAQFIQQSANAVVSGVAVVQQPSCYQTTDDATGDPFLGLGGQQRISQVMTGKFELVMHMGDATSGTSNTGSQVNTATIELANPDNLSEIASWASISE